MSTLWNQLLIDLKKSWKKTALLGVLFVVGLCFWLPPILRAMTAGDGAPPRAVQATPPVTVPVVTQSVPTETNDGQTDTESVFDWRRGRRILKSDPLLQSAVDAAVNARPFQIDQDQFPPPVLIAEDTADVEPEENRNETIQEVPQRTRPERVSLKSTIIGSGRRAAFIDGRLRFLGDFIESQRVQFELTAIEADHIVLSRLDQNYTIWLNRQTLPDSIRIQRSPR